MHHKPANNNIKRRAAGRPDGGQFAPDPVADAPAEAGNLKLHDPQTAEIVNTVNLLPGAEQIQIRAKRLDELLDEEEEAVNVHNKECRRIFEEKVSQLQVWDVPLTGPDTSLGIFSRRAYHKYKDTHPEWYEICDEYHRSTRSENLVATSAHMRMREEARSGLIPSTDHDDPDVVDAWSLSAAAGWQIITTPFASSDLLASYETDQMRLRWSYTISEQPDGTYAFGFTRVGVTDGVISEEVDEISDKQGYSTAKEATIAAGHHHRQFAAGISALAAT